MSDMIYVFLIGALLVIAVAALLMLAGIVTPWIGVEG